MADLMQLAADERGDLADFLGTLTDQDWAAPSLCEGWTVRDVVAHVVSYEEVGYVGIATTLLRARFRPDAMNDVHRNSYRSTNPNALSRHCDRTSVLTG